MPLIYLIVRDCFLWHLFSSSKHESWSCLFPYAFDSDQKTTVNMARYSIWSLIPFFLNTVTWNPILKHYHQICLCSITSENEISTAAPFFLWKKGCSTNSDASHVNVVLWWEHKEKNLAFFEQLLLGCFLKAFPK